MRNAFLVNNFVEHEQTTQKGQGHRVNGEMHKTYPESRNTEDLQEGLWANACTDDHKSDGWMDNPQNISSKAKACLCSFYMLQFRPLLGSIISTRSGQENGTKSGGKS